MHGTEPEIYLNRLLVSQMENIPQVFDVIFLKSMSQCQCPFTVCLGSLHTWNKLWNQFNHQHWVDSLQILEGHPTLFQKC